MSRIIKPPKVGKDGSGEDESAFLQWLSFEFPEESKALRSCLSLDYASKLYEWLREWREKMLSLARFLEGKTKCADGIFAENVTATVPCERIWLWSDCFLVLSGSYSKLFIFDEGQRELKIVKAITFPLSSQKVANLSGEIGLDLRNYEEHDISGSPASRREILQSTLDFDPPSATPTRQTVRDSLGSQTGVTGKPASVERGPHNPRRQAATHSGPLQNTWHMRPRPHVSARDYSEFGFQTGASVSGTEGPDDLYRGSEREPNPSPVSAASVIARSATTTTSPAVPDGYDIAPNGLTYCISRAFRAPQIRKDWYSEDKIALLVQWLSLKFPEDRKPLPPCLSLD